MKKILLLIAAMVVVNAGFSQKRYFTKTGTITFEAGTSLEDITAINKSTTTVVDAITGQVEFALLIKGFEFKRSLMQEHFNENYMESDQFPKAVFKGKITNIEKINLQKDGVYPVKVAGTLEMHGIKKSVDLNGTFTVSGGYITATSSFVVVLQDYGISIPGLVKDKISKTANISVRCIYTPL